MKIVARQIVKFNDTENDIEGLRILFDDKIVFEQWDEHHIGGGSIIHDDFVTEIILEMLGHKFTRESDYPEEGVEDYADYLHDIDGNPYDIDDFPGHRD